MNKFDKKFSSELNNKFSRKLAKAELNQIKGGEGNSSNTSKCTLVNEPGLMYTDTLKDGDWYPSC